MLEEIRPSLLCIQPPCVSTNHQIYELAFSFRDCRGGLLSGHITKVEDFDAKEREGGRWDKRSFAFADIMRKSWGPLLHIFGEIQTSLVSARPVSSDTQLILLQTHHGIRMSEAGLRWLQHHSVLTPGDAVILGARDTKQLEENINGRYESPLLALDYVSRV